jgi:putative phage-type endonuclease
MIETILPSSEEHWLKLRTRDVTSTEVSCLFGCSPYSTLFELWHRKKQGHVIELEPNERMLWGSRLQDAIANGIAEDQGWSVRKAPEYIRHPELRMGSSFDFFIAEDGILEVKNVDSLAFRDGWIVDGETVEAPPHIELQVQHQLALTRRKFAYIGALIGGNRTVLLRREPDPDIISSIHQALKKFWLSIDEDQPPAPDFEKDASFIAELYSHAEPGKTLSAHTDDELSELAYSYHELGQKIKELEAKRDGVKAQMLMRIGEAEKVLSDLFTITANLVGPSKVSFERKGYRCFRVNWRKNVRD